MVADLGVNHADIAHVLARLTEDEPDLNADELPDDAAEFLRQLLDPHGERTAPIGLYWPDADPDTPPAYGLGGPDSTAPDHDQPQR
jgi:hypothetical protein